MNELDVGAKGLNSNDYHTFYTYLYSYLKYDVSTKTRIIISVCNWVILRKQMIMIG